MVLAPLIAYYIYLGTGPDTMIAAWLLVLAGISDGLDGYLARRLNQVSRLGVALDPIADKILAGIVVIALCLWRDFPLWLAGAIVGRDLLIMLGGIVLLKGRSIDLPSNLTGKYAFTAIATLIGCYLIRFEFGIVLLTWSTLFLLAASLVGYGVIFTRVKRGEALVPFQDRLGLKIGRTIFSISFTALFFFRLYTDMIR